MKGDLERSGDYNLKEMWNEIKRIGIVVDNANYNNTS